MPFRVLPIAITGKTAAEIVYESADHTKEHMELTTWKYAPDGHILKSDTPIEKNYLDGFREKGVRFIAISNGVDSTQQSSNEFAPFLNIMNEWYVRDTSRKIKSVLHTKVSPEDWIFFENTQEPIVDEDTWHTVQKIRETKHRPSKRGEPNPLTGLMFCADYGAKMFNHRTGDYEKKDKNGNPTGKYTNA